MEGRGDSSTSIAKRLEGDDITFDPKTVATCDFYINSGDKSVEALTAEIVTLYRERLASL